MTATADIERARAALYAIPPDLPRDDWVKVAMAANAAGLDLAAFNDWSAQADSYDPAAARDVWKSIKPGKGIGAGTLYRTAAERAAGAAQGLNSPAELPRIGAIVAGLRGIPPASLAEATASNARRVLAPGLDP